MARPDVGTLRSCVQQTLVIGLALLAGARGALGSDAEIDFDFALRLSGIEAAGIADGTRLALLRDWERSALSRGRKDVAAEVLEREIAVRRERPDVETGRLFDAMSRLGGWLNDVGPYDRAELLLREALGLLERVPGDRASRTQRALSALETTVWRLRPDDPERESLLLRMLELDADSGTRYRLGSYYRSIGRFDDALIQFDEALASAGRGPLRNGFGMTVYLVALGRVHHELGRDDEAELLLMEALRESEAYFGPAHPRLASPLKALGGLLLDQDRDAEAELYLELAAKLEQAAWGEAIPCGCPAQELLARYDGRGDTVPSEPTELDDPRIIKLHELEASIRELRRVGEFEQAITTSELAVELRREVYGAETEQVADGLDAIARLMIRRTRHADAIDVLRRSVALRESLAPSVAAHRALAAALEQLAGSLRITRRYDDALQVLYDEIRLHETDARRLKAARRLEVAGHMARTVGDTAEARELFERAAETWRDMASAKAPEIVRLRAAVATTHTFDGAFGAAEEILVPLLAEVELRWPRERATLLQVRHPLRELYKRSGRAELASELQLGE